MTGQSVSFNGQTESFDQIVRDLQALRETCGQVSYAELVRRIADLRLARGVNAAASIPPRSTVYNAFREGRARMDTELMRDIVLSLGVSSDEADAWVLRCQIARKNYETGAELAAVQATAKRVAPVSAVTQRLKLPRSLVAVVLMGCIAINLIGLYGTHVLSLSVYLDMLGTAIASIVLGPWQGVFVAIASSNLGFLTGDPTTGYFTPVNVVGALLWGYGIRRVGFDAGFAHFVGLTVVVAIGCSLVAAPIIVYIFGTGNEHASMQGALALASLGLPFIAATFSSNLVASVLDKLVAGFIALAVLALLQRRWGERTEVAAEPERSNRAHAR